MNEIKRDRLGYIVRESWIAWAREQPNHNPSWLVPHHKMDDPDKEASRQIGERLYLLGQKESIILEYNNSHRSCLQLDTAFQSIAPWKATCTLEARPAL